MLFMISSGVNSCMSSSSPSPDISSSSNYVPATEGQSFTVDNITTTLVSAYVLPVGSGELPRRGNEYIVVRVKIFYNGAGNVAYSERDFHAASGASTITNVVPAPKAYKANKLLDSGTLTAGSSVIGDIIFQVPKGDHNARLTWQPIYIDSTTTYSWNLGL